MLSVYRQKFLAPVTPELASNAVNQPATRTGTSSKIGEMEGHHLDGHHWQILLTKDGVPGNWEGDYKSREEALAVVRKEFEKWRV